MALPLIAHFSALIADLERRAVEGQAPPAASPDRSRANSPSVSLEELRVMAPEIARDLIAADRRDHLVNPTSRQPFRHSGAIPPRGHHRERPAWGTRAGPMG